MHYTRVCIDAFGYELPPNVVTTEELEEQLEPLYEKLHFQPGQLAALTGIWERRFWDPGFRVSDGALAAGRKALENASIRPTDIGMLIYGAVCRNYIEPATACAVCHGLGLPPQAQVYDISNACLGVLNGMVQVANAIELGQIKAGMVVACETSREVVEATINQLNRSGDMQLFKSNIATMTGGSGAVAVILAERSPAGNGRLLLGGTIRHAAEHHQLCMWGGEAEASSAGQQFLKTDALGVLENGVRLGTETFAAFKNENRLGPDQPDKIVCHQVGESHQKSILKAIDLPAEKDYTTFKFLGNIGSVSLPLTAAIAEEREHIVAGDLVGFLGIGSGLNCMMLAIQW
jgi:3-oxoacyl-[acyl-carrier-protein] synthase-3